MIEIWQANCQGKYNHPDDVQAKHVDQGFLGFGDGNLGGWKLRI